MTRAVAVTAEKYLSVGKNQDVPLFQLTNQSHALTINSIRLYRKKLLTFMACSNCIELGSRGACDSVGIAASHCADKIYEAASV